MTSRGSRRFEHIPILVALWNLVGYQQESGPINIKGRKMAPNLGPCVGRTCRRPPRGKEASPGGETSDVGWPSLEKLGVRDRLYELVLVGVHEGDVRRELFEHILATLDPTVAGIAPERSGPNWSLDRALGTVKGAVANREAPLGPHLSNQAAGCWRLALEAHGTGEHVGVLPLEGIKFGVEPRRVPPKTPRTAKRTAARLAPEPTLGRPPLARPKGGERKRFPGLGHPTVVVAQCFPGNIRVARVHVVNNAGVAAGVTDGTLECLGPRRLERATPVAINLGAVANLQTPQTNRALGRVPVDVGREVSLHNWNLAHGTLDL